MRLARSVWIGWRNEKVKLLEQADILSRCPSIEYGIDWLEQLRLLGDFVHLTVCDFLVFGYVSAVLCCASL